MLSRDLGVRRDHRYVADFEIGLLRANFTGTFGLPCSRSDARSGVAHFFLEAVFIGIFVYGWDASQTPTSYAHGREQRPHSDERAAELRPTRRWTGGVGNSAGRRRRATTNTSPTRPLDGASRRSSPRFMTLLDVPIVNVTLPVSTGACTAQQNALHRSSPAIRSPWGYYFPSGRFGDARGRRPSSSSAWPCSSSRARPAPWRKRRFELRVDANFSKVRRRPRHPRTGLVESLFRGERRQGIGLFGWTITVSTTVGPSRSAAA